jgi:hypothetical protein
MANIPNYTPGQVANAGVRSVRMPSSGPEAFGAEEGGGRMAAAALGQAGAALVSIAVEQQERTDKATVREALATAQSQVREFLTKDIFTRNGSQAAAAEADARKRMTEFKGALESKLGNARQKEMFHAAWLDLEGDSIARVQTHQVREMERYEKASRDAQNFNEEQDAALFAHDPQRIQKAEWRITRNTVANFAGMGEEVQKAHVRQRVDHLYATVAESLGNQNPLEALKFINAHQEKLSPSAHRQLQTRYENEALQFSASQKAIQAVGGGMGLEDARAMADKEITNPQERERFMAEVKTRLAEKEAATTLKERQKVETAWQAFLDDPGKAIPKDLPADEQMRMLNARETMARRVTGAGASSPQTYGKLVDALASGELADMNLRAFAPELSQNDLQFFLSQQNELRKGGSKETAAFKAALADAKQEAGQLGIFKISEKEKEDVRRSKQDALNQYLAEYARRLRAVPDEKRMDWQTAQKIRDELLKEVVLEKRSFMGIDWLAKDKMGRQFQADAVGAPVPADEPPRRPPASAISKEAKGIPPAAASAGAVTWRDVGGRRIFYNAQGAFVGSAVIGAGGGAH